MQGGRDVADSKVHGYSMIRTQANVDYFHDLYDQAQAMGIDIECHRAYFASPSLRVVIQGYGGHIVGGEAG